MLDLEEGVSAIGSDGVRGLVGYGGQLGGVGQVVLSSAEAEDDCIRIVINILVRIAGQFDLGDLAGQCGGVEQNRGIAVLITHLNAVAVVTDLSQVKADSANCRGAGEVGLICQAQRLYGQIQDTVLGLRLLGLLGIHRRLGLFGLDVRCIATDLVQFHLIDLSFSDTISGEAGVELHGLVVVAIVVSAHILDVPLAGASRLQSPLCTIGQSILQAHTIAGCGRGQVLTIDSKDVILAFNRDLALCHGCGNAQNIICNSAHLSTHLAAVRLRSHGLTGVVDDDLIACHRLLNQQGSIGHGLTGLGFHRGVGSGVLPADQHTALDELDLGVAGGVLIVLDVTLDGDGIANADLVSAVALQAVALDGHGLAALHHDGDGDIAIVAIIRRVDLGDLAGEGSLVRQLLADLQLIGSLDDLQRIGGSHGGVLLIGHQSGVVILDGAVAGLTDVVGDVALNGDGVANADDIRAGTLHAVAQDGLGLTAFDDHGDGHVAVSGVIGGIDLGDLTGQGGLVLQRSIGAQSVGLVNDYLGIAGLGGGNSVFPLDQLAACGELDGAVALVANIVGDVALDGDQVIDTDLVSAVALQAVADDGLALAAFDLDGHGDVAVLCVVGSADLGDDTGQGSLVRQGLVGTQGVSLVDDLLGILGSLDLFALDHCIQGASGVELDGAVVVLQHTGDGDGVADLQVFAALTLQAVALNGHILSVTHDHHHGDVLVAGIVRSLDHGDLTHQGNIIAHVLAGGQSISGLHDLQHILGGDGSGQDVVPGVGHTVAGGIGDGGGQNVGDLFLGFLVDVDGDHAVLRLQDLDGGRIHIHGPDDFVLDAVDRHDCDTLEILGSGFTGFSVDSLDILKGCLQAGGVDDIQAVGGIGLILLTACEHTQAENDDQSPCKYSFHSKLLCVLLNTDIILGEYFDLIGAVEVVHNALDTDGLAFVGICGDQLAVLVHENSGAHIDGAAVHPAGQGKGALGCAVFLGGGVGIHHKQVLHFNGGAHGHGGIGSRFGIALFIGEGDLAFQELFSGGGDEGRLVTLADLLNIAGIVGLHEAVVQVGDLVGATGFIILDGTHDADLVAHIQDIQTLAVQVIAIVDGHTVVHIRFGIVSFHIDAVAVVDGDNTVEGNLHAVVGFHITAQLLQSQLHSFAVVEFRVLLAGVDIELLCLCLVDGCHADVAVLIVGGAAGDGQTVLQDLNVQVAVGIGALGLVPDPDQVTVAGGIGFPGGGLRFDDDGGSGGQLLLGEGGSLLTVLLDLAGGLGGVDGQVAALQDAAGHHGGGHKEVGGITVDEHLDRDLFLGRGGVHVQFHLTGIVHNLACGRRCGLAGRGAGRLAGGVAVAAGKDADCKADHQ